MSDRFFCQDEPSVNLKFVQYPKFPYKEELLKVAILTLVEVLMSLLEQNRVVMVFDDETIMMEEDEGALDPGIDFNRT